MQYAIIDESGRFGDPESKFLVFAVVATRSLIGMDKIIPAARRKIPRKGKRKFEKTLAEIKFSTTGDKTRMTVLDLISKEKLELFILVVDSEGKRIEDNPENYSLLVAKILNSVLSRNPNLKHVIIDRHFTWITQREKFNTLVQKTLKKDLFIEHLDSQQNTIVSLADFVAGAIREYYSKRNRGWREIIVKKIVNEERTTWKKLKHQKR